MPSIVYIWYHYKVIKMSSWNELLSFCVSYTSLDRVKIKNKNGAIICGCGFIFSYWCVFSSIAIFGANIIWANLLESLCMFSISFGIGIMGCYPLLRSNTISTIHNVGVTMCGYGSMLLLIVSGYLWVLPIAVMAYLIPYSMSKNEYTKKYMKLNSVVMDWEWYPSFILSSYIVSYLIIWDCPLKVYDIEGILNKLIGM